MKPVDQPKFSFGSSLGESEELKEGYSEPLQSLNSNIQLPYSHWWFNGATRVRSLAVLV